MQGIFYLIWIRICKNNKKKVIFSVCLGFFKSIFILLEIDFLEYDF